MTMTIGKVHVACCGNCGHELEIRCTGGCPEPDTVPREDYIATMKKPQGKETPRAGHARLKPPRCPRPTHCHCGEPVASRSKSGIGRPPSHCEKHLDILRSKRQKVAA